MSSQLAASVDSAIVPSAASAVQEVQRRERHWRAGRSLEGLALVACMSLACGNVFFPPFRENVTNFAIVLLPFLVWAAQVMERQAAQRDLRTVRDDLEKRVAERTDELSEVNAALTKVVTEHQLAKRLLETQARVLRHMAEAVILADEDGGITYSNAATETMFGYTPDELLGRPLAGLMDESTADKHRTVREISMQLDTGKTWFGELTNRKRDGTPFTTIARISPLEIAGKKVRVCVQQDLTELKHARERSLQFERLAAIGQMVTGLAHESGNALQQIQGAVEMLARRLSGEAETDLLHQIQQAQDRLHRLLEDLRGYAAPIRLDRQVQNLAWLWREAWSQLASRHANREVHFYEFSNGVDLSCLVDPFPMERVFRNILENSLAACADPVRIEVRCSECRLNHQPTVSLSFRDNGPGLNAEQQRRIFEPFFTTKTTGTGLGMAITKRIVEAHGGQVSISCDNEPGVNIVILLPRETP